MALRPCSQCGKDLADTAAACPHCGHHFGALSPQQWRVLEWVGGVLAVIIIAAMIYGR